MNLEELRQQWTVAQTSAAAAHAFWELYAAGPGGNPSPVTDSDPALQLVLQHEMIRPGSAVLDLGCGTGRYAAWFAQKGCRVTGFDLSETAAAQARQRFREAGLPDAEFVTGDWHGMQPGALDWDRKFDLVFCHMSPAVQSYDTFERLYRCSRGWCLMAKPTFRKDAVSRYLRPVRDAAAEALLQFFCEGCFSAAGIAADGNQQFQGRSPPLMKQQYYNTRIYTT
jgi:SAM-dependent methyltransferase